MTDEIPRDRPGQQPISVEDSDWTAGQAFLKGRMMRERGATAEECPFADPVYRQHWLDGFNHTNPREVQRQKMAPQWRIIDQPPLNYELLPYGVKCKCAKLYRGKEPDRLYCCIGEQEHESPVVGNMEPPKPPKMHSASEPEPWHERADKHHD